MAEEKVEDKKADEMTDEELEQQLANLVGTVPTGEGHANTHTFLAHVVKTDDTTRVGNLTKEEVGEPRLPLRTYKDLALFCSDVANMDYFSKYFLAKAEIITSTSLSKNAKLINLAVVTRKELADVSDKPERKENRGWFRRKNKPMGIQEWEGGLNDRILWKPHS